MASSFYHTPEPSGSSTTETVVESSIDHTSKADRAEKPAHALPPVIPSAHQHRTLVLCFDGTGDQFDDDNSNIVQFVSLLKKDDRSKQLVYYQTGIGTYTGASQTVSARTSQIRKMFDTMFAHSIGAHIMGGYKFLMQNYISGDKIYIFGFSRGAYTARCLAGMLHKVGLLPASNTEQVPFAYTMYLKADKLGWRQSNQFKKAFAINVDVEFLGVWDTVGSIGFKPAGLPFASCKTFIKTFRHAVSLDERRAKFQVNLWNEPEPEDAELGIYDKDDEEDGKEKPETDVKEVWFAGCHCDVGGGSVRNGIHNSLARIPLRWMVREIFEAKTGILFVTKRLREIGLDPSTIYPVVLKRPEPLDVGENIIGEPSSKDRPFRPPMFSIFKTSLPPDDPPYVVGTEEEEELADALSPMYDQMTVSRFWGTLWRFVEFVPLPVRRQWKDEQGVWKWATRIRPNLFERRKVRWDTQRLKIHRSVKMRMDSKLSNGKKYEPGVITKRKRGWLYNLGVKLRLLDPAPVFVDLEWVE
ncbi:hypothetical protein EST38_g7910 [Candolleomyces aberdarensis]|uniref:T6SS Phospholipase effector Tle1-like catalytic domain-containing protein n=1 Tax=Candolleomyces aberdarensis TaxID=2316362 RepID=A0A4Q2DFZ7_9AGAR|nr:hypothetical protein EST38_g7910 [Candolleomyces aberdarensis]